MKPEHTPDPLLSWSSATLEEVAEMVSARVVALLSESGLVAPAADVGPSPIMTSEEVSSLLRVPLATVYRWRSNGTGPVGTRVGKRVTYRRADVLAWYEEQLA